MDGCGLLMEIEHAFFCDICRKRAKIDGDAEEEAEDELLDDADVDYPLVKGT